MLSKETHEKLLKIAQTHMGVKSFDVQGSDEIDFHDIATWSVETALQAAYNLGRSEALKQSEV